MPTVPTEEWGLQWWKSRHEQKVERIRQGGHVDILMIGDSITHQWEQEGLLVWKKYYEHRKAINLGFNGDCTEHVLWRLQNGEIDGITPKLTILMIGTNNTRKYKDPAKNTAAGIKAIIKELRIRLPETKILLLAIFPTGSAVHNKFRKVNDEINTIISGYADNEHIFYLDINRRFLDHRGNLSQQNMPDLLHLNERGYQIWAEAMERNHTQANE